MTASRRATQLAKEFREILAPHSVDVRGEYFPGWPVDETTAETMQRDAIDIDKLWVTLTRRIANRRGRRS